MFEGKFISDIVDLFILKRTVLFVLAEGCIAELWVIEGNFFFINTNTKIEQIHVLPMGTKSGLNPE